MSQHLQHAPLAPTSVRVMLNTGILLPTSSGNVQHLSWFWRRMVHSRSQLGRPETICCEWKSKRENSNHLHTNIK